MKSIKARCTKCGLENTITSEYGDSWFTCFECQSDIEHVYNPVTLDGLCIECGVRHD